jgi:hypothetical protein
MRRKRQGEIFVDDGEEPGRLFFPVVTIDGGLLDQFVGVSGAAPLPVAPETTSHPGYRPMPKNATIRANLGFVGLPLQ